MNTVLIDVPDKAYPFPETMADDLGREILVAAVIKWFEIGKVSQDKSGGNTRTFAFRVSRCTFRLPGFSMAIHGKGPCRGIRL